MYNLHDPFVGNNLRILTQCVASSGEQVKKGNNPTLYTYQYVIFTIFIIDNTYLCTQSATMNSLQTERKETRVKLSRIIYCQSARQQFGNPCDLMRQLGNMSTFNLINELRVYV